MSESPRRSVFLVAASTAAAVALVLSYLAAGGASYEPLQVRDPCEPREWRSPGSLEELAEQFTLSALDGAACELRVTREVLVRALASEESREAFMRRYRVDDAVLEDALRAGLVRAIDDAEQAGAIPSFLAGPLRESARRLPVDEALAAVRDARRLLRDPGAFLDGGAGLLDELGELLP